MANTFKFGNGKWAVGKDTVLAYNDENSNFKPLPFTFDRASTATVVNKNGLIETVGTDEPRIDFLNNTSGHLLLEPSRSNLITYSEDFTQWTKQSITDGEISLVSNSLTGSVDASELEDTSTSNYARLTLNTTTSASTAYRFSCFVKKTTGVQTSCPAFQLEVGHDYLVLNTTTGETKTDALDAGNTNYSDINVIDFNSEWWKLEMTATSVGTSTRVAIYPAFTGTFGSSASSSNIGTVTIYGIQVEQGSYATSYIPTSGSSVTRSAETCSQISPSSVIGQTEGSAYFEYTCEGTDSNGQRIFVLRGASTADRIAIFDQAGKIRIYVADGGVLQLDTTTNVDTVSTHKVAFRYKLNDFKLYIDGTAIVTDATFTVPTLNSVYVGTSEGFGGTLGGNVSDVKLYDTALSDSELQALTS